MPDMVQRPIQESDCSKFAYCVPVEKKKTLLGELAYGKFVETILNGSCNLWDIFLLLVLQESIPT